MTTSTIASAQTPGATTRQSLAWFALSGMQALMLAMGIGRFAYKTGQAACNNCSTPVT